MQNLIQELLNPGLGLQGEIVAVSTVKRRAAQAIQDLSVKGQADLLARLQLEKQAGFEAITLASALEIYRECANLEYQNEQT